MIFIENIRASRGFLISTAVVTTLFPCVAHAQSTPTPAIRAQAAVTDAQAANADDQAAIARPGADQEDFIV